MVIFELIKKIETPVLVFDKQGNLLLKNIRFDVFFEEFESINEFSKKLHKFKNSFNIQSCMLNAENISEFNPIDLALKSKESFKTFATYQKTREDFLTVLISSYYYDSYIIIEFINYTDKIMLDELSKQYDNTKNELKILKEENTRYLETKDKAQIQAIKMALLNRVFEALRQSIDLNTTLNLAFKEISDIFGFSKVAFAFFNEGKNLFEIKNIYPEKYSNELNQSFNIDKKSLISLKENKHCISNIVQKTNTDTISKTECRILMPVFHTNKLLGTVYGIFQHKNSNNINDDMISAISSQMTSAIVQSYLFEELNSKNEQLQNAYTKLEQAQLQLVNSEKMASLGQLVAGVAHEINTPLASINSNNSIFEKILNLDSIDNDMTETLKSMVETDKEAIKRISNIVQSLKRFVRLDEAELQNADINKELDLTLELLKHETKRRIEIIKDYCDNGEIMCFPNLLNQVFMNILMNAIQSIEGDGKIYISTKKENNTLKISIKDTGSGMDEATKNKIFKTGFTTKKIGIGTGLGLMISKDIIEKHSGTIDFKSSVGEGTEFIISIPDNKRGEN